MAADEELTDQESIDNDQEMSSDGAMWTWADDMFPVFHYPVRVAEPFVTKEFGRPCSHLFLMIVAGT